MLGCQIGVLDTLMGYRLTGCQIGVLDTLMGYRLTGFDEDVYVVEQLYRVELCSFVIETEVKVEWLTPRADFPYRAVAKTNRPSDTALFLDLR